jgi:hypothetical protein
MTQQTPTKHDLVIVIKVANVLDPLLGTFQLWAPEESRAYKRTHHSWRHLAGVQV